VLISVKKVVKEILKQIGDFSSPPYPPKGIKKAGGYAPRPPNLITATTFVSERQSQRQKQTKNRKDHLMSSFDND